MNDARTTPAKTEEIRKAPRPGTVWTRLLIGALVGLAGWALLASLLPHLPMPVRFVLSLSLFIMGPGAAGGVWLTRRLDPFERLVVLMGFGTAAAPVLGEILARFHLAGAFPYVACAMAGAALAIWRPGPQAVPARTRAGIGASLLVASLALGSGAIVFAHRLSATPQEITVFGDYDSVDLIYYAAITGELTHRVPPAAPFYAGHPLNYSYYPQLLLAEVHRFAGVPILHLYFRFAWPAFLALGMVVAFVFIRAIASDGVALLASSLILLGGDFSYLAAWLLHPATYLWDYLLWPTNFLAPTMEVLHFSTWTPSLPVLFAGLFAVARYEEEQRAGWMLAASLCFAALVEFKPFAYAVLMGGLCAAALFSGRDVATRRRLASVLVSSLVLALPLLYHVASLYAESRSHLKLDYFLLPRTMLEKLALTGAFNRAAGPLVASGWLHSALVLGMATALFFLGGLGMRWIGVAGVWQTLLGRSPERLDLSHSSTDGDAIDFKRPIWRLLAWTVLVGAGIPFVIVTEPYHDTLQFYQTALFILWIFTAYVVLRRAARTRWRALAVVLTIGLSIPSSLHYLTEKWGDGPRHPLAHAGAGEIMVANYLRALDPERVVMLHDRPLDPSLFVILSERRAVLAWARYVTGSEPRRRDVDRFFASADGNADAALEILRRYGVTHVIDRIGRDRIHPAVLARLRLVLRAPDVALYEVPSSF